MKQIPLKGKRGEGLFALVDDEDYELLIQFRWNYSVSKYPRCSLWIKGKIVNRMMHIMIMGKLSGHVIDHINGNTLDNQRINLRYCTIAENARNRKASSLNRSGFKGVYWDKGQKLPSGGWKKRPCWVASIRKDDKQKLIGYFDNLENAVRARIKAEIEIYGDFAKSDVI